MRPIVFFILMVCSVSESRLKVNTITQGWAGKKADIYFLIDSSSSIWVMDYREMLAFVSDMVSGMDIGPDKTRVGVGLFSDKFKEFLPLNNGRSKDSLVDAIQDAPYVTGSGYISRGIEGVRMKGLSPNSSRKGVPLITVLFTDGESRHHQLTIDNTTLAKKEGIYIYTVGIGRGVDKMELRNIASDPKDDFTFLVPNFASFRNIKHDMMRLMSEVQFLQGDEGTCGKKDLADVVFVFDEFSLGQEQSKTVKNFIKSLVKEFSMDSGNIRVGIVSKTCNQRDITLGQFLTQQAFMSNIDNQRGPTISTLLRRARLEGFLPTIGGRSHVRKRIIMILKGTLTDTYRLRDEARRAKFNEIEIFILPIDVTTGKGVLEGMTSDKTYITPVDSVGELQSVSTQFLQVFCRELN